MERVSGDGALSGLLFVFVSLVSLSAQCATPCDMADIGQIRSAGKHLVENPAVAKSPDSRGALQAVAPAAQQGHANSLQGVASPGVHAEGARLAIHPQSGGRETEPILSPLTLVATHDARRPDSSPATGATLLFPQQDQEKAMTALGTVTDEEDSELRLEENPTDGPGLIPGRHDDGNRVEVDGRAPWLTQKRAAVPSIPEDDPVKSPVDSVSHGVVLGLPADVREQSRRRKWGMSTDPDVLVGSDPTCTGDQSLGTISKYQESNCNKVMPKIGVMSANYSSGGTAQESYSPFEPRRSDEIHDSPRSGEVHGSPATTPVNGGADSDPEGRNYENHDVENVRTGAKPSRPPTSFAKVTNQDVDGWNDEDPGNETGDDRPAIAGVKPIRSLSPSTNWVQDTTNSGIRYCQQNPTVTMMVILALGWRVLWYLLRLTARLIWAHVGAPLCQQVVTGILEARPCVID